MLNEAKKYEKEMVGFLGDIIALPSESGKEGAVIARIENEMKKVGFDSIKIDKMGNILGWIGKGKQFIAMDAHIDTVGSGNHGQWKWDPYRGKSENDNIYGRGAVDQKAGMASFLITRK